VTPRLFFHVLSNEARTKLSYRAEFWITAVAGFVADFGVAWFLWLAMFHESGLDSFGGRDFHGMVIYYLMVILMGKLIVANRFDGTVSGDIYEGGLTRYLLFPTSYMRFKYAQHLGLMVPQLMQIVLFGAIALPLVGLPAGITMAAVLMSLCGIVLANLLYFVLETLMQQVAFWQDNVWSLSVGLYFVASLFGGRQLPLNLFPQWAQDVLAWLPFRFLFDFPARLMLGEIGVGEWGRDLLLCAAWCAFFELLRRIMWRRGQLQYTGVGI